jgi:hypothetical protein
MVGRQIPRDKERLVDIRLGNGFDRGGAESIAPHRQVADIVLVELDLQLLLERQSVKTRGLTEDRMNLLGRHAVIDDEVETDLGQREVKFLSCAVDRARGACQVRTQIDDWNDLCVGHPTLPLPAAPYCPESNAVHSRDGRNRCWRHGYPADRGFLSV